MVRATANEPSEDRKDTSKKKIVSPKKKNVATGVWPCKINGCNKQFAREADLKRHQRTTKLHSMPGFSCPQCDATFTRTDALRRHQKSRHNGVVIEPPDSGVRDGDDELPSSGSSRSGTPSAKGKKHAPGIAQPAPTRQPAPAAGGPSSYYRQHTMTMTPHIPPRSTTQYHIGLPESATRLNSAHSWAFPHPWPVGTVPPNMAPMGYPPIPPPGTIYYPSPHYRQNGIVHPSVQPPQPQPQPPPIPNGTSHPHATSSNGSSNGGPSPVSDHPTSNGNHVEHHNIDPTLDNTDELTREAVQSALEALVKSTQAQVDAHGLTHLENGDAYTVSSLSDTRDPSEGLSLDADANDLEHRDEEHVATSLSLEDALNGIRTSYGQPLERPEPMEHLLTEDGEPMLNPAELLTQESLASPPPS
ncbi:hypothetical protein BDQ12DRAFT_677731 [Crucibulum laeve]|uniref:C2H2-type domain-containing protein n=1 Tax=Crucibulum laeve TaxID=68775 RepID=A0A5C3M9M2_9AGAR|nr:hypothetical protein BDQ12DRAFT_677731 [Crucibulum laeve]